MTGWNLSLLRPGRPLSPAWQPAQRAGLRRRPYSLLAVAQLPSAPQTGVAGARGVTKTMAVGTVGALAPTPLAPLTTTTTTSSSAAPAGPPAGHASSVVPALFSRPHPAAAAGGGPGGAPAAAAGVGGPPQTFGPEYLDILERSFARPAQDPQQQQQPAAQPPQTDAAAAAAAEVDAILGGLGGGSGPAAAAASPDAQLAELADVASFLEDLQSFTDGFESNVAQFTTVLVGAGRGRGRGRGRWGGAAHVPHLSKGRALSCCWAPAALRCSDQSSFALPAIFTLVCSCLRPPGGRRALPVCPAG